MQYEIDFSEVVRRVWSRRILVAVLALVMALACGAYSLTRPDVYRAEVLLMPTAEESSGLDAIASRFGGLAGIAGINLNRTDDRTALAVEMLKSRAFANRFVRDHELVAILLAGTSWDRARDAVAIDPKVYDSQQRKWVRRVANGRSALPTETEIYEAFKRRLTVAENKQNGFVRVSFDFIASTLAKRWLDLMIVDLNRVVREREAEDARRNIAYLEQQIPQTRVAEVQKVLYDLLEEQVKVLMLTQARDQYAFKIVDPPIVSDEKIGPKRVMICLAGGLIGLVLGSLIALGVPSRRADRSSTHDHDMEAGAI